MYNTNSKFGCLDSLDITIPRIDSEALQRWVRIQSIQLHTAAIINGPTSWLQPWNSTPAQSRMATYSEALCDVYTGVWTNWDHNSVFGATLTLSVREPGLLVTFVAIFLTVVGTRFWRIACFALHQILLSKDTHDGLYHQRQAVLCNSSSATSALTTLVKLSWAWRSIAERPYRRTIPIVAFAVLCIPAITVTGVFSSRISLGGEVLISSPGCGWVKWNSTTETCFSPHCWKNMRPAVKYAQQCYTSNTSGLPAPSIFSKTKHQPGGSSGSAIYFAAKLQPWHVVKMRGSQSLTSKISLLHGIQGSLPDNQWQLDVQNWFETSLAYLQATFVVPRD